MTSGGLGVSSDSAGNLRIWTSASGEVRVNYTSVFIIFTVVYITICYIIGLDGVSGVV